jgi:hypothetical protein
VTLMKKRYFCAMSVTANGDRLSDFIQLDKSPVSYY